MKSRLETRQARSGALLCAPSMKKTKRTARVYQGIRVDPVLLARIERLASAQKTSPRAVWEQLAERGLPQLEQIFGIVQEAPPTKAPGEN